MKCDAAFPMRAPLQTVLAFVAGAAVASMVILVSRQQDARHAVHEAASAPASTNDLRTAAAPAQELAALEQPAGRQGESRTAAEQERESVERVQKEQIAALRARVRELERRTASADPEGGAAPPTRMKFHDLTQAELQAMAHNCEVRFDLPRIAREPFHLSPERGAQLHLSDPEQDRVSAAVDAASKDVVAHLRALYLEATGDAVGADALDPQSLMREILEKSPPAAVQAARTEIARERAGLPSAPSGTIAERYLRYITSVGDSLQRALEPALGAQQAAAVRDALAESRSSMSGCPK
jgi:hypothetical protein